MKTSVICLALLLSMTAAGFGEVPGAVRSSGITGGVIVHLGCGDGGRTADLYTSDSFCVHGLDVDAKIVEQARAHIQSQGLYGRVSVATFDGVHLPYIDNMVNLVVRYLQ